MKINTNNFPLKRLVLLSDNPSPTGGLSGGILRVRKICRDYGIIEPKFEEVFDGFRVTLFKEKVSSDELNDELNDGLNDGLNERQKKVLKEIKNKPGIKGKELSEQLNIPIDTIDRYIKLFTSKNLVERKGSKKTGGYFVIKQ